MHLLPPQQPVVPPLRSLLPAGGSPHCPVFFPQEPPGAGGEREEEQEEEQAFLVSLYKFMKERRTPIERVPHLGFKQSASPGCRRGGGRQGTSIRGDPDVPQGLHTERLPPPGTGLAVGAARCPSLLAPSTQGAVCPAIPVALSGYVLVLCQPDGATGTGGWLPPPPTKTDGGRALLSPVNLWKIYKAVEKLGAYELVRMAPLSPHPAASPGTSAVPPGPREKREPSRPALFCRREDEAVSEP